jgi:hypothetical protein
MKIVREVEASDKAANGCQLHLCHKRPSLTTDAFSPWLKLAWIVQINSTATHCFQQLFLSR